MKVLQNVIQETQHPACEQVC